MHDIPKVELKRTAENFRQLCTGEYRYVCDLHNKETEYNLTHKLLESIQDPKGTRMRRFIGQTRYNFRPCLF